MPNPPINISSLEFNEIKTSLINYLKNQTYFNSYNYNDTALSTLIDVLAYNTMYYSYYANMIANETFLPTSQIQENVLSILKPLGYVINGTNSSKITATLTGNQTVIEEYTSLFRGVNPLDVNYNFYPIENYTLNATTPTEIVLYDANTITKDKVINDPSEILTDKLDLETQSYYLGNFEIDINTLSVYVDEGTGYIKWSKYDQYNPKTNSETDRIYFIERRENGFYLLFSRPTINEIFGFSGGKKILTSYKVKISFIKPNGVLANNCALRTTVGTLVSSTVSANGGTPDLDIIKSFAPKLFASSDRAVTKDDYYGVILNSNAIPSSITTENQIIVWGGEELKRPVPGRVFYSFADLSITADNLKSLTNILKQKGMMTIIPEYIPPKNIMVKSTIRYIGNQNLLQIQSDIFNYYNLTLEFNKIFSNTDILLYIINKYPTEPPSLLDVTSTVLEFSMDSFTNVIELFNQLKTPATALASGTVFYTSSFVYNGTTVNIRDLNGSLILWNIGTATPITNVGTINYTTGDIYINKKFLNQSLTCTAIPNNSKIINSKYNNLLTISPTVVN